MWRYQGRDMGLMRLPRGGVRSGSNGAVTRRQRPRVQSDLPEAPFNLPVVLRYQLFEHLWQTAPTDCEGELVSLGRNGFLLDIENIVRKGILSRFGVRERV